MDFVIVYSTDPSYQLCYMKMGMRRDVHSCGSVVSLSNNLRILRPLMKLVNDIVYATIGCFSPSVDVGVT